jgi:hypothetical protein
MKSYDVFMDSGVNVKLPDCVDPESEEGETLIREAATEGFVAVLRHNYGADFTWQQYEGGE